MGTKGCVVGPMKCRKVAAVKCTTKAQTNSALKERGSDIKIILAATVGSLSAREKKKSYFCRLRLETSSTVTSREKST